MQEVPVIDDDPAFLLIQWSLVFHRVAITLSCLLRAENSSARRQTLEAHASWWTSSSGKISGVELIRALCLEDFAVPVIFITGSHDDLHRRQAMELGCAHFY